MQLRFPRATRSGALPRAVAMAASSLPSAFQPQPLAGPRPTRKEKARREFRRSHDRRMPYQSAALKSLGWHSLGATLTKNFSRESLAARPGFSGQALPATGLLQIDPAFGTGRDWVTKPTIKKRVAV